MNLVNEAALLAARRGKRVVTMAEFEDSKDKIMMGAERRTMVMTEQEKMLTAYHEGGHAIVALNVPATDPVHKATIIPRGRALGMVMQLPERDKLSTSYAQMTSRLAVCMGGRVAEEIIFGKDKITSGAQSDIEQATKLARAMVTRWGFSDELGTVMYGENQEEVFLGYSMGSSRRFPKRPRARSTPKCAVLSSWAFPRQDGSSTEKRQDLEALARGLLEYETLSGDEIIGLLQGRRPVRENPEDCDAAARLARADDRRRSQAETGTGARRPRAPAAGLNERAADSPPPKRLRAASRR